MKVVSIVGARPQFIKAAPVSSLLREGDHQEILLHTGQHYDYEMSQVFFDELGIPQPDLNIDVGSGTHGWQTGQMLIRIEKVLLQMNPDVVLVYGDTNSTLAGALAACKLRLPLAHIEAGLRSHNREMPEEHNRVLTDHCSDFLFCPTRTAVENLASEGLKQGVVFVGDTMYDAVLKFMEIARKRSNILQRLGVQPRKYFLATLHRAYNTDVVENLHNILCALTEIGEPVIFPAHPRTRNRIEQTNGQLHALDGDSNVRTIDPVSYLDMLVLEENARAILTDSGGMQKEAYFLGVPCITLRPETEWIETVEAGWNKLVGANLNRIVTAVKNVNSPPNRKKTSRLFGQGDAALRIVKKLESELTKPREYFTHA
ncbi:MAG: non-hydrolyzing UDP-N-acetylglucosamine 2-epimerase [bacterium]